MDPRRLARLLDSPSVPSTDGAPACVPAAWPSEPRTTLVPRGILITGGGPGGPDTGLAGLDLAPIELPVAQRVATAPAEDAPAEDAPTEDAPAGCAPAGDARPATAGQVVDEAAPGRGAGAAPRRRPVTVLAAALLGAVSLGGLLTSGERPAQAAAPTTVEAASVAEELGLLRAQQNALTGDEAALRLEEMVASRALREDAATAAAEAQAAADQAARDAAAAAAAEAARPDVVLPVSGARLTSGFGTRWGTLHAGIDLAAPMHTPEYAVMDGVVLKAGAASGYGLAVYLQHGDGTVTVYGHMDSILVQEGQSVRAGDTIALLGNRGQSSGPHLHFEVHRGGMDQDKVDPVTWLREHGVGI